jgi:hypothetical protein
MSTNAPADRCGWFRVNQVSFRNDFQPATCCSKIMTCPDRTAANAGRRGSVHGGAVSGSSTTLTANRSNALFSIKPAFQFS